MASTPNMISTHRKIKNTTIIKILQCAQKNRSSLNLRSSSVICRKRQSNHSSQPMSFLSQSQQNLGLLTAVRSSTPAPGSTLCTSLASSVWMRSASTAYAGYTWSTGKFVSAPCAPTRSSWELTSAVTSSLVVVLWLQVACVNQWGPSAPRAVVAAKKNAHGTRGQVWVVCTEPIATYNPVLGTLRKNRMVLTEVGCTELHKPLCARDIVSFLFFITIFQYLYFCITVLWLYFPKEITTLL